jgi:hypothetical protein
MGIIDEMMEEVSHIPYLPTPTHTPRPLASDFQVQRVQKSARAITAPQAPVPNPKPYVLDPKLSLCAWCTA